MKFRVQWTETSRREAEIEAASLEELQENWDAGYMSAMVDELEDEGVEIDGGIDWDSVAIVEVK